MVGELSISTRWRRIDANTVFLHENVSRDLTYLNEYWSYLFVNGI